MLYQHGITSVTRQDGLGMMQVGWTLWQTTEMHQYQAYDFLTDGFGLWIREEAVDYTKIRLFLTDMFDTLCAQDPPQCPPDIYSAPRELVDSASAYFGARAWAGSELIVRALEVDDTATLKAYEDRVFVSLVGSNPAFLPTAVSFDRATVSREPWSARPVWLIESLWQQGGTAASDLAWDPVPSRESYPNLRSLQNLPAWPVTIETLPGTPFLWALGFYRPSSWEIRLLDRIGSSRAYWAGLGILTHDLRLIEHRGGSMACACIKAGKPKCAWCKEAEAHGMATSRHNCQWGSCS